MSDRIDQNTVERIRELVRGNFSARDDLYAAAHALDDEALREICTRLADRLGGNAADLQQLLVTTGEDPAEPNEILRRLQEVVVQLLEERHGTSSVIEEVEAAEHQLKEKYDEAIEGTPDRDVGEILKRQRDEVKFGENVLSKVANAEKKSEPPSE